MITLQRLEWRNFLSYQDKASIDLSEHPLTQLVGENGAGKTTIPLVVQEVLYGKNIKNIRKQDLVNRHTKENGYTISLEFTKENNEYKVELDRKSTIKLSLFKNGDNISSHKSIDTYKTIASIIGIPDFKTFCQLVYQSSTASLEFLTATDTNRKKFLISLLQLEEYTDLHELFKGKVRDLTADANTIQGELNIVRSWVLSHENEDFSITEIKEVPENDISEIHSELAIWQNKLDNIVTINRKITTNNQYKKELASLNFNLMEDPESVDQKDIDFWDDEMTTSRYDKNHFEELIENLNVEDKTCPTCKQVIPATDNKEMLIEAEHQYEIAKNKFDSASLKKGQLQYVKQERRRWEQSKTEFEKLIALIDNDITNKIEDKSELETGIKNLKLELEAIEKHKNRIIEHNKKAAAHNSKVKLIKEQLEEYQVKLNDLEYKEEDLQDTLDILELLKKIFSTNGLVSYKIESSVKELEKTINEYLAEFTHFRVFFKLERDKLNIQVIDEEGEETTIEGLSAGELGRVNIATTLAIRKIMSSLSSTKINFLFLDEIVGVLDTNGKEKLIELLLNENLNSFIVAHEFDHPLVPKLYVVKEDNASRIENG